MRREVYALFLPLLIVLTDCAVRSSGKKQDLGGGFSLVRQEAQGSPETQGDPAADHLFFRGVDLGEVEYVSVAPSGDHAIFTRGREIFLIASATGKLKPITDGRFSEPKDVRWREAEGLAEIEYRDDHPISRIALE